MRNVVLFDMDGTLTPARQAMERPVTDKLIQLQRAGFEIEQSELNEIQPSHEKVSDLEALRERTEDWTEDIEEADILQNALLEDAKSASEDNEEFSSEIEIE